eukprot:4380047-Ditylum_brightwellii.AAC.1
MTKKKSRQRGKTNIKSGPIAKVVPSDVVKENASIFKRGSYTIFGSKVIIDKARMTTRPITILPMTESLIPQVGRERKLPRVR